jgi:hypothetical protein
MYRVARNRVFSENLDTPPKNYEKPGFFGFCRSPIICPGGSLFVRESAGDLNPRLIAKVG